MTTEPYRCGTTGCRERGATLMYAPDEAKQCPTCGAPMRAVEPGADVCPNQACRATLPAASGDGDPCPRCHLSPREVRVMGADGGPGIPPEGRADGVRPAAPLASGVPVCPTSASPAARTLPVGRGPVPAPVSLDDRRGSWGHRPDDPAREARERADRDRKRGEHHEAERDAELLADPVLRHLDLTRNLDDIHDRLVDVQHHLESYGDAQLRALQTLTEAVEHWGDHLLGEVRDGLGTGLRGDDDRPIPGHLEDVAQDARRLAAQAASNDLGLTAARCLLVVVSAAIVVALVVGGIALLGTMVLP